MAHGAIVVWLRIGDGDRSIVAIFMLFFSGYWQAAPRAEHRCPIRSVQGAPLGEPAYRGWHSMHA